LISKLCFGHFSLRIRRRSSWLYTLWDICTHLPFVRGSRIAFAYSDKCARKIQVTVNYRRRNVSNSSHREVTNAPLRTRKIISSTAFSFSAGHCGASAHICPSCVDLGLSWPTVTHVWKIQAACEEQLIEREITDSPLPTNWPKKLCRAFPFVFHKNKMCI